MNRRDLIKAFATAAPLTVAGRVWAAPATDARLLVVFLRGAYDAANVVVPVGSDFYHASRPTLGIAKPETGNPNAALSLGPDWGLHPSLRDSIYPFWAKREIAFVPFAGTSDDVGLERERHGIFPPSFSRTSQKCAGAGASGDQRVSAKRG